MAHEFKIAGHQVARFDVGRYGGHLEEVTVFRAPEGWSVLTVSRFERYDDGGSLESGEAWVSATTVADLDGLREVLDGRDAWSELLEAGHEHDRDLYAAWVPLKIDRELDQSSIYNRDLAQATAYLGGRPVPAPGRALPGWEAEATAAMATHLEDRGWRVRGDRLPAPGLGSAPGDNTVLGLVEGWRYGWAVAIVVRVDFCGEVYARRADDEEVQGGAALRPLSEAEEDEAWSEQARRPRGD